MIDCHFCGHGEDWHALLRGLGLRPCWCEECCCWDYCATEEEAMLNACESSERTGQGGHCDGDPRIKAPYLRLLR
jgi:hypothetical protein